MNATFRVTCLLPLAAFGVFTATQDLNAATFTAIDGEGFEAPDYSTTYLPSGGVLGQLEGQVAATNGGATSAQWVRTRGPGAGQATVQTSVVESGSQAIRVDRAANSDDSWAVPVSGYPAERFICIEWDMLVEQTVSTAFGPFFGIEAYDDDGPLTRMGMLGVDASTGEILYTDSAVGLLPTPGGETVNFGEWNSFRIVLDFMTDTYLGFVNDGLVITTAFEFPGADEFTDADIAALAAGGDVISQGLTGTAYFDNYMVFETDDISKLVPEPASLLLVAFSLVGAMGRRLG